MPSLDAQDLNILILDWTNVTINFVITLVLTPVVSPISRMIAYNAATVDELADLYETALILETFWKAYEKY